MGMRLCNQLLCPHCGHHLRSGQMVGPFPIQCDRCDRFLRVVSDTPPKWKTGTLCVNLVAIFLLAVVALFKAIQGSRGMFIDTTTSWLMVSLALLTCFL